VAALVMMADAVEASSRVLNDPTPARISALVDKIINHIFLEGQLDECELTLKDISEIKGRFAYILTGIFHKRIDYPGFDFRHEHIHKEPAKIDRLKPEEVGKGSH
jgi:membrane-associated HD superfamily phosphohydrolase